MPLSIPAAIQLPGLRAAGNSPAERRDWLLSLGDSELAGLLLEQFEAVRSQAAATHQWASLADCALAPHPEVVGSVAGLRAVCMAASHGACLVHHELRLPVVWPDEMHGDDRVADEDHASWVRGNLHTGKYQGFLQDDPLSAFQPHHMAKWTPHELLHRAAAFFWRADASAWELYVGARLNELVPVVLWYGLDEIGRRDGRGFDRAAWSAAPHVTIADATWLSADADTLQRLAQDGARLLRHSVEHFEREWKAIESELRCGVRARVADDVLDASSDALAYVVGHQTRLADRAVSRCFERILRPGRDVFGDVTEYATFVEQLFDDLLFADLSLDAKQAIARRDARALRDWVQRAAHFGWNAFRRVVPLLPEVADAIERADHAIPPDLDQWRDRLRGVLEPSVARCVLASGYLPADHAGTPPVSEAQHPHIEQLHEGLRSVCPRVVDWCDEYDPALIVAFAGSQEHWRRAPLPERFATFLRERELPRAVVDLVRLEQAVAAADARVDDNIEVLAVDPDAVDLDDAGTLVWNSAFDWIVVDAGALALHAGEPDVLEPPPACCIVGSWRGGVSLMPVWQPVLDALHDLRRQPMDADDFEELLARSIRAGDQLPPDLHRDARDWIHELLGAGAIGYFPRLIERQRR